MADKISTIILKVDLDCHLCYKKIRKTLCKLQDRQNIQSITYDEKKNTVTISGPFDPHKLSKKLCCKASKVIKDIQIKDPTKDKPKDSKPAAEPAEQKKDKPKDTKPADEPKKDKPKDTKPADEPKKEKPKDAKPADEPKKEKPKDTKPADEPKKDKPKADKPAPPPTEPVVVPVWQAGPSCFNRPWNEGYYGDFRGCGCGCGCGQAYGWASGGPPPVVCGGPPYGGYKSCQFFCEEDPQSSCSIM